MSKFRQNRSNGLRATSIRSFQDLALHLCAVCCDVRCRRIIEVLCCIIVQQKSDELRFNGHALHSHTNARLDLENFEWVYLKDRLTDFDEIRTGGSWLQVAANFVPPHEFGLKLCP